MLNIISLGAGVQSSTMALMAARGEITPMPDGAIFADTGAEPKAVYEWLGWIEKELPFPVYRVQEGNIREDIRNHVNTTGQRGFSAVPWYMITPRGKDAMGRRQCTSEYKLKPIRRKLRELVGLKKGQRSKEIVAHQWIGISWDEMQRMKESRDGWVKNIFPLIDLRMTRRDCLKWMEEHHYQKPPRSACIFCPFKSNKEWRLLKDESPNEWAEAVQVDREIRNQPKIRAQQFAHSSRTPLDEVDLSTAEERGQYSFLDECEGMCGARGDPTVRRRPAPRRSGGRWRRFWRGGKTPNRIKPRRAGLPCHKHPAEWAARSPRAPSVHDWQRVLVHRR